MPNTEVGVKFSAEGVAQLENSFRRVATSAKGFNTQATGLGTTLKSIASWAVGFVAFNKIKSFIEGATQAAMEDNSAMNLMASRLESLGVKFETVKPKVDSFIDSMFRLGRDDEEVALSMSKIATRTGDIDKAMKMTRLASDLAASGIGDLTSNADSLARILIGKGARALLQFGVAVKDNATIAEQLAAVQERVTRTTEQWANTAEGKVARMKNQYSELKEGLGKGFIVTLSNLTDAFNTFYNDTGKGGDQWGYQMGKLFNVTIPQYFSGETWAGIFGKAGVKINTGLAKLTSGLKLIGDEAPLSKVFKDAAKNAQSWVDESKQSMKSLETAYEAQWKNITKVAANGTQKVDEDMSDMGDTATDTASKMKSAFESMAKTVVGKVQDQIDKIADLRQELADLSLDTDEQLAKAEEARKGDLSNMVRSTKDKIDQIDKEIADTQTKKDKGWRDKIAELQAERAKENSILTRIGNEGVNIAEESAKDELTILKEKHLAEIEEIKAQGAKKKEEIQIQMLELELQKLKTTYEILKPGGLSGLANAEVNANAWESPTGTTLNFNLNNVTVTDKNLLKTIIDAINRASELKQFK